jgi:transcriptional regulator with PAS, ATPase and Fis domain
MPTTPLQLIGTSASIAAIQQDIACAGNCSAKVLITGESGVGKDIVARLIHQASARRDAPLVTINCAALPDSLLESQLFGHVRGSFTGADRDRDGLLQMAAGGTMLMDEVSEMSARMQAMLLRFLETGEIQKVGANSPEVRVDVRIVAATNRDLLGQTAAGRFREDLYYRLNVIHVVMPPLRDRTEDIPLLIDHFLALYSREYGVQVPQLSPEDRERLRDYPWPGNVRELKNFVERLVVTGSTVAALSRGRVTAGALSGTVSHPPTDLPPTAAVEQLFNRITTGGESFWDGVYVPFMSRDLTRDELRWVVRRGLEEARGSYKLLVELFNMPQADYKTFLNVLRKHDCHMRFQRFRRLPAREADAALAGAVCLPRRVVRSAQ